MIWFTVTTQSLSDAASGGKARRHALQKLFSSIAPGYDALNHLLSLGLDIRWQRALVKDLAEVPEGPFLDLAAGTFDLSLALARALFPASAGPMLIWPEASGNFPLRRS